MYAQCCMVRVRKNHMLNYEYERVTKSKVCQILISWVDKVKARRAQTDPQTQKKMDYDPYSDLYYTDYATNGTENEKFRQFEQDMGLEDNTPSQG